jgi:Tc toxin complex TcA C-terminal TcB-binding domain
MRPVNSFHGTVDQVMRDPFFHFPVVTHDRKASYHFFEHFHPYVPTLIDQLNAGGIKALLDADTEYSGQTAGPSTFIPNSTRCRLASTVSARQLDGTPIQLAAGTPMTVPDVTSVTLPAGTSYSLPGTPALDALGAAAIQFPGEAQVVKDGTEVTLPNGATRAVRSDDGFSLDLPAGTQVYLSPGMPQRWLYRDFFNNTYSPNPTTVPSPYPTDDLDFSLRGAYAIYNWELFFHAPLLIAIHLSQNQKFKYAQTWFHYIFDPTDNSSGPTPERFWKVLPFQSTPVEALESIITNLSTRQDAALFDATVASISDWTEKPFQPWEIGKYRPSAYMYKTVMAYLDNLIAWGDSLFQQYTIETINEATQIYILAALTLGRKPQPVPTKGKVKPVTYADRRGSWSAFGDALVDMESDIPFDLAPLPAAVTPGPGSLTIGSLGQTLYFCLPHNDTLLAYWDTVADRLFKIHNSLNIQGVFQQLPLYDPPIDPALLVRAVASGLDIGAAVNGLNQPLPLVRFQLLVSKAAEICQEVKSLGAAILSAMEKQDNEALGLIRAQHESTILTLAQTVKYGQWQDASKAREALERSLQNAQQRYGYYQKLLGRTDAQITTPTMDPLDTAGLNRENFTQDEPLMPFDPINPDISTDSAGVSDGEITTLSNNEVSELKGLSLAQDLRDAAAIMSTVSSALSLIPEIEAKASPMGVGAAIAFGGQQLGPMMNALAVAAHGIADRISYEAGRTAKIGSYQRRQTDWLQQSNAAKGEINQIVTQLRGAEIREAVAEMEYNNHQTQMQQAQAIIDFLQGNDPTDPAYASNNLQPKETTVGFYAWCKRESKALYAKSFQLAFEVAKKAERAMQHELGDSSLSFIQYGYLDGMEGLFAGERLLSDIKTMEMAHHDLNRREYELTKHVSLLQIAPLALVQLRATGSCSFAIPEEMFDLDCPGHYFRRMKSIAITVPAVVGPYSGVNCTLTLQQSTIRTSTELPNNKYARAGQDDGRFDDYFGTIESVVTSSGQSDSGLFETNLNDERYLPFERTGVAGCQCTLSIPADIRQFDFDTISDVILHIRYTAREGGAALAAAATANLQAQIKSGQATESVRLFSVRHEFPNEWAKFKAVQIGGTATAELQLSFLEQHYPFWAQGIMNRGTAKRVQIFAEMPDTTVPTVNLFAKPDGSGQPDPLSQDPALGGLLTGSLSNVPTPQTVTGGSNPQPLTLYSDKNSMTNLWVAVDWGGS